MRAWSLGAVVAVGVAVFLLVGFARTRASSGGVSEVDARFAADLAHPGTDTGTGDRMPPGGTAKAAGVDPKVLTACAGRYRLQGPPDILEVIGDTLAVTGEGDRLSVEGKRGKLELVAESEMTFLAPQYGARVTFVEEEKGRVSRMRVNVMGLRELSGTRIE
jgi:hypothetical protein